MNNNHGQLFMITLLVLLVNPALAFATTQPSNFTQVQAELSKQSNISGNFKQIKIIKLLSQPLVSTGHFSLSKQYGLQWLQTTPFKSRLMVTQNKIVQQLENNPPTVLTQKQQPIIFSFSNIFLNVFNGNISQIRQYFDVDFSGNLQHWQLTLKPKDSPLNKAIKQIQLSGDQYIRLIRIEDTQNNQTQIILYNVQGK